MSSSTAEWLGVFDADVPAGCDGVSFLRTIPHDVPPRGPLRFNAHRERYCLVAALRWLVGMHPELFPARVARVRANQSPDFVLTPLSASRPVALEHCDAGLRVYQRWLDRTDHKAVEFLPSPNDDGWVGDAPERSFENQVTLAVCRKRQAKAWRHAPDNSSRLILVYDNTSTGLFINDQSALHLLGKACVRAQWGEKNGESVLLIRSQERVLVWGVFARGAV